MTVEKKTDYGNITVSSEAVATLVGSVITECYGVVGMASKQVLKDGWAELLKKGSYTKGVVVRHEEGGLAIDLYIIVSFGVKISEVVQDQVAGDQIILAAGGCGRAALPCFCLNFLIRSI